MPLMKLVATFAVLLVLAPATASAFDWYVQVTSHAVPIPVSGKHDWRCLKVGPYTKKTSLPVAPPGWSCRLELSEIDAIGTTFRQFGQIICAEDATGTKVTVTTAGLSSNHEGDKTEVSIETKTQEVEFALAVDMKPPLCLPGTPDVKKETL